MINYLQVDTKSNNYELITGVYFPEFNAITEFKRVVREEFNFANLQIRELSTRQGNGDRKEGLLEIYFNEETQSKFWVYCFQTEGGGRRELTNEGRIQWRANSKWNPNLNTLYPAKKFTDALDSDVNNKECYIISFYKRNEADKDIIISAVYATQAQDFELSQGTSTKSIQFKIEDIRIAFIEGISATYKSNRQSIIHFKPRYLLWYMINRDALHMSSLEEFNALKEIYLKEPDIFLSDEDIPQNRIFYGAPGTGKSYKIKYDILNYGKGNAIPERQQERITFHPDYDNAAFVGSYMPTSDDDGKISYQFVPQVFTNIYVRAWQNPDKAYFLVIEEINRGNCAEIFGDIFQLLDRKSNYAITPKSALQQYLIKTLGEGHEGIKGGKMILPSNLQLLATMNTSDQSLFPMDSAFKRRWTWKYVPIDYNKNEAENTSAGFVVRLDENRTFSWLEFIEIVNKQYIKSNENLGEDKCIGNYFIKPDEKEISLEEFINKAIFYLWVDVFQEEEETPFEKGTTYSDFFPEEVEGKALVEKMLQKLVVSIEDSTQITEA